MLKPTFLTVLLLGTSVLAAQATALRIQFDLTTTVKTPSLGNGPLALSPDGQTLAVLNLNRSDLKKSALIVYDMPSGRERWRVPQSG